jgi:hypothetical protein
MSEPCRTTNRGTEELLVGIWRSLTREAMGAWRSIRYDLHRRPDTGRDDDTEVIYPEFDAYQKAERRQPRRLIAAGGVGVVVAGGVAGTYFAVAGGLGALLANPPTGTTQPAGPSAAASAQVGTLPTTDTSMDASPPASPAAPVAGAGGRAPARMKGRPAPGATSVVALPSCLCDAPLPTPNDPTPSDSPSAVPSPSASAPSPVPTGSRSWHPRH